MNGLWSDGLGMSSHESASTGGKKTANSIDGNTMAAAVAKRRVSGGIRSIAPDEPLARRGRRRRSAASRARRARAGRRGGGGGGWRGGGTGGHGGRAAGPP